VDIPVMSRVF